MLSENVGDCVGDDFKMCGGNVGENRVGDCF